MSQHTTDLKQQIERILNWGPPSHWRERDFAQLSEQVLAYTNRWVESHDLQIFWRSSVATPGLLDALTQFADYADWGDFCDRNQVGEMIPAKVDAFHAPMWEVPTRWVVILCWLSVLASALVGALLVWKR